MNQAIAIEGPWNLGIPRSFVAPAEASARPAVDAEAAPAAEDSSWELEVDNTTRALAIGYFFQHGEARSNNPDMPQVQRDYHDRQSSSYLEALAIRSAAILPQAVLAEV